MMVFFGFGFALEAQDGQAKQQGTDEKKKKMTKIEGRKEVESDKAMVVSWLARFSLVVVWALSQVDSSGPAVNLLRAPVDSLSLRCDLMRCGGTVE